MLPYDDSNPKDIERYAKGLIGKTFQDVLYESKNLEDAITDSKINFSNPNQKGKLGNLLEEKYFCYKANGNQEPDFPKCGVELKTTCFDVLENGELSAGERLVLTMISYNEPIEKDFFKSHVWEKCRLILLIYYERNKKLMYNTLYRIKYVSLWTPFEKDIPIILEDYNKIIDKIKMGYAHTLSEGDTMYLGACTKGKTSAGSMKPQYYNPAVSANKRAFCFKRKYMDYILHTYIIPNHTGERPDELEAIIDNPMQLQSMSFEEIVCKKLDNFRNWRDSDLCNYFGREYNCNKAQWTDLTYRMLGIKGNHAEEFAKANIVVKVVRIEDDYSMDESISLPPFNFIEFANERWEDSQVYNYFSETKFFFVVFVKDNDVYRLNRYFFWNMPFEHLNETVRRGWENFHYLIKNQLVKFKLKKTKKGNIVKNNLPKKGDNPIIHIRPHAQKSAYSFQLPDGKKYECGNIERDANLLPQGDYMTTQSFWINNNYFVKYILRFGR